MAVRVQPTAVEWLTAEDNPAVAVMARRLFGEQPSPALDALWNRRNDYAPVARILDAMNDDGSWGEPSRNYIKYTGTLWQIHFLGDPRDERVIAALGYLVRLADERGAPVCSVGLSSYTLNGYCHMLAPKVLLFLAEVPESAWPDGAAAMRDALVERLREREVFRYLPDGAREFEAAVYKLKPADAAAFRERYLAEHGPLVFGPKPGWLRFGYPLSYNSDVLEALLSLAAVGEPMREEYAAALAVLRDAADSETRWAMRNSFNGKMIADVEKKGQPSRWLTLRALRTLAHFGGEPIEVW